MTKTESPKFTEVTGSGITDRINEMRHARQSMEVGQRVHLDAVNGWYGEESTIENHGTYVVFRIPMWRKYAGTMITGVEVIITQDSTTVATVGQHPWERVWEVSLSANVPAHTLGLAIREARGEDIG